MGALLRIAVKDHVENAEYFEEFIGVKSNSRHRVDI